MPRSKREGSVLVFNKRPFVSGWWQEEVVERALADQFEESFALGRGDAEVAAREAVACWDEAGIFVAAADGLVSPRLRLFAEIGAALFAHQLSDPAVSDWVQTACEDETRTETLRLACGLDNRVAELLCERACSEVDAKSTERLSFVLAQAAAEGAVLAQQSLGRLTERLLALLTQKESAWRAALAIARIPVPSYLRNKVREEFAQHLPATNLPTVDALATLRWEETGESADGTLVAVLSAEKPISAVTGKPSMLVDDAFAEAVVGAAERLRSTDAGALEEIAGALGKGSMGMDMRLREILTQEGRADLVKEYDRRQAATWNDALSPEAWSRFEGLDRRLLTLVRNVAEPKQLTQRQARRLDELSDFITSLHFPDAPATALASSVDDDPDLTQAFVSGVAPLTGLDLGLVAAEAELMLRLLESADEREASLAVWDGGAYCGLARWDRISRPGDLRRLLYACVGWHDWPAWPSASALSSAPQREEALVELQQVLDDLRPWSRFLASKVMMLLDANDVDRAIAWLDDSDPVRRRAAAGHLAKMHRDSPTARAGLERALSDADEGVRAECLEALSPQTLDARIVTLVRREAPEPPTGWYCIWCGTTNLADAKGCISCRTSGPEVARAARALLAAAGLKTGEGADQDRRHAYVVEIS